VNRNDHIIRKINKQSNANVRFVNLNIAFFMFLFNNMGNNTVNDQLCNFGFKAEEMGLAKDVNEKDCIV
jgi:hypothetical protein